MRSASDLAAWGTYIFGRMSGFGPKPAGAEAPGKAVSGQPTRIVGSRGSFRDFFTVVDGEVRHRVEPCGQAVHLYQVIPKRPAFL